MSSIPSSAMPHAYAEPAREERESRPPKGLLVAGAAVAAYLLYKVVR
jgi:hypothetical protein